MLSNIPGYTISEKIHESRQSLVYRAVATSDSRRVILKTLNHNVQASRDLLSNELNIIQKLDTRGVIKSYGIINAGSVRVLLLEEFGGDSLESILRKKELLLREKLRYALRITEILGEIHKRDVIHKDLNPTNIVLNLRSEEIKLIDFGISTELHEEIVKLDEEGKMAGTLLYMSPEQTGRMNRPMDYRTDYYSLGATFYRMFTDRPPFKTRDPSELVHCHMARRPTLPHKIKNDLPPALSEIIMKLMAKNPEDRYQSTEGIKADISFLMDNLETKSRLENFSPGKKDFIFKFHLPSKLYGRERELATLFNAFKRGRKGRSELLVVSGQPGIGKSRLIYEVQKPVVKHRGYFISGKYGVFQKHVPYSGIIHAFSNLVRQVLTESKINIEQWRKKLSDALGENGRLVVDMIPELELVIGPQPTPASLGPIETRNRFNHVFRRFLSVFTAREHPVVLFLDDLQWADGGSLELIRNLLSDPESRYLLVIGSYRQSEVGPEHNICTLLDEIRESPLALEELSLEELPEEKVALLLCDAFQCDRKNITTLVDLVFSRTGGNPYFINEFLKMLHQDGLVSLNHKLGWTWDIEKIAALPVSENIVSLMSLKINRLSPRSVEVLRLASCIGNRFRLKLLSELCEKSEEETLADLTEALQGGLIQPVNFTSATYRFAHDRVQEAAYALLPNEESERIHYKIGLISRNHLNHNQGNDTIFFTVNQLNLGINICNDPRERRRLARLNLRAAQKAKISSAYEPATKYVRSGIDLLAAEGWLRYKTMLGLHTEGCEIAYLMGNQPEMDSYGEQVLNNARKLLDKIKIYDLQINVLIRNNQLSEAINLCLVVLRKLNIKFPAKPGKIHVLFGLLKIKLMLGRTAPAELLHLPHMKDREKLAAMDMLRAVSPAAYWARPDLVPLLGFKMLELSLKYGNCPLSAFAYSVYGLIHTGHLKDIPRGYEFGQLAEALVEKLNARHLKNLIINTTRSFIYHWKRHARLSIPEYKDGFYDSLAEGDQEWAAYHMLNFVYQSIFAGKNLEETNRVIEKRRNLLESLQQLTSEYNTNLWHQLLLNLMGKGTGTLHLAGPVYDESEMLKIHKSAKDQLAVFVHSFARWTLAVYFGDLKEAVHWSESVPPRSEVAAGILIIPYVNFYDSLTQLAQFRTPGFLRKRATLRRVARNQKQLNKWAKYAPENLRHKYYLVQAELLFTRDRELEASRMYDLAIELSAENHYPGDNILANERAGLFYLACNRNKIAGTYFYDAFQGCKAWGAGALAQRISRLYGRYFPVRQISPQDEQDFSISVSVSESGSSSGDMRHTLDLSTFMKATSAISSEIILEKLLDRLMEIIAESAGAQRGCLLLKKDDDLLVEAVLNQDSAEIKVLSSTPLEESRDLSPSVVHYVLRTGESLVLDDAQAAPLFCNAPYIVENQTRSVLCSPIKNQGKLMGIIYLENNLSPGLFTKKRLNVVQMLSSQAAISIENAHLYDDLEERVNDRTGQLRNSLSEVRDLKAKQDADYFLTSMLLSPLSLNRVQSGKINVDFLIRQKKNFHYKKWDAEIGGDLCIAHNITLDRKRCVVYLNADAMGKSMQGAGGAIVLGSLFQSLVERTQSDLQLQNLAPELWLHRAFQEMHQVFMSFAGAMLVSVACGILEEESGRLHHLNAEHPSSVLLRNGTARFIETTAKYHKLGASFPLGESKISAMNLENGDVLVMGSDGRDDIWLHASQEEHPVLNDNERDFLQRVEEGNGVPESILTAIQTQGDLNDDFSLLALRYGGKG